MSVRVSNYALHVQRSKRLTKLAVVQASSHFMVVASINISYATYMPPLILYIASRRTQTHVRMPETRLHCERELHHHAIIICILSKTLVRFGMALFSDTTCPPAFDLCERQLLDRSAIIHESCILKYVSTTTYY